MLPSDQSSPNTANLHEIQDEIPHPFVEASGMGFSFFFYSSPISFFKDCREVGRPYFDLARANVCNRRLAFFGDLNR